MNSLVKYESARFALQEAAEIDEVKDIRDKAEAMAAYARQANDTKLVEWATEIKVRAERKAGQMLAEMPKNPGKLNNSSWSHDATATKTLEELGIKKDQSSRWQRLASVPDEQFEQAVSAAKEVAGEVTTAAMLRIEKANRLLKPAPILEVDQKLSTGNHTFTQADDDPEYDEESIRAEMADSFDPIAELEAANKEIERLNKIIESDDRLATAMAENKRLAALVQVTESLKNGYMVSLNELKQSTRYWKTRYERLEKEVKASGMVAF